MANVVFVAPYAREATARFVDAVIATPDTRVGLVSTDPAEAFPEEVRTRLAGHWRTDNCFDVDQLAAAVGVMGRHLGGADRLLTILENLMVPVGAVRERLGIAGLGAAAAERCRDKALMKQAFEAAGVPCARSQRVESADDARRFAATVGYPLVVKPLAGAGARSTFRLDTGDQLERWLHATPPTPHDPSIAEEFVTGAEHSFDSMLIDGQMRWFSVNRYLPGPLAVVENPWIQWTVVLPHGLDRYRDFAAVADRALAALGLHDGLSHMEWFIRPDGSYAVSEVGARPPGAQFMTLMSFAHDVDMYDVWARQSVHGWFDPPTRRYAVGAAYLRAQGAGRRIVAAEGLDEVSAETRALVVAARLPAPGAGRADTYEGDGYVVVRHADTEVVERAVAELVATIRLHTD